MERTISSVEQLYREAGMSGELGSKARFLIEARGRFHSFFNYDPVTGDCLETDLDTLLERASHRDRTKEKDRFRKILSFAAPALVELEGELREKAIRAHEILPLRSAREFDSASLRWLSKRPGRNVREKISDKQRVLAVRHLESLDTLENRLLKAFVERAKRIIDAAEASSWFSDRERFRDFFEAGYQFRAWLNSDEAAAIGPWTNLPPNNTLLSDRHYRKIWNAWRDLQSLDEGITQDSKSPESLALTIFLCLAAGNLHRSNACRIIQQPVRGNWDSISVELPLSGINFYCKVGTAWKEGSLKLDSTGVFLTLGNYESGLAGAILSSLSHLSLEYLETVAEAITVKIAPKAHTHDSMKQTKCGLASVDLCSLRPYWSCLVSDTAVEQGRLSRFLLRQVWAEKEKEKSEAVSIDCSCSKAILEEADGFEIKTISIHHITGNLPSGEIGTSSLQSSTALEFTGQLSDQMRAEKCIYLLPDSGDDFSFDTIRRSMNARFRQAEPLPRSVAKVFSTLSREPEAYAKLKQGGELSVAERGEQGWTLTRFKALYNEQLEKLVPETLGLSWERFPSSSIEYGKGASPAERLPKAFPRYLRNVLSLWDIEAVAGNNLFIQGLDADAFFVRQEDKDCVLSGHIPPSELRRIAGMNPLSLYHLNTSAAEDLTGGAIELYTWQKRVPDIPLWRDHLPPLSMEIYDSEGKKSPFVLVGENAAPIVPKRGTTQSIRIDEEFTLPAGRDSYHFPLIKGEGKEREKYWARLESRAFPLAEDTVCTLTLSYTYGGDNPYDLRFTPTGPVPEFFGVTVEWTNEPDRLNLGAPSFPKRKKWDELINVMNNDHFSKWEKQNYELIRCIARYGWRPYWIENQISIQDKKTTKDTLQYFASGEDNDFTKYTFYENSRLEHGPLYNGDVVYAYVRLINERGGATLGSVSIQKDAEDFSQLNKTLIVPSLRIWNQGRSLDDSEVPPDFRCRTREAIEDARSIILNDEMPLFLKSEVWVFLCCMHRDMPPECLASLSECFITPELFSDYYRQIAYAMGEGTEAWQKELFCKTLGLLDNPELSAFGWQILSIALWRTEKLIRLVLEGEKLSWLLDHIVTVLQNGGNSSDRELKRYCLEILLALFRLREGSERNVKELLSPFKNKRMQMIVSLLDSLSGRAIDQRSRIDFSSWKRVTTNEPPLIHAVKLYAHGDPSANSIALAVKEEEED